MLDRDLRDDPARDLMVPILLTQTQVVRLTGYFTAGFLGATRAGWDTFAVRGGVMRVVTSERLARQDRDCLHAATPGSMPRSRFAAVCKTGVSNAELLRAAVSAGVLEIKTATPPRRRTDRLMHAKMGAAVGGDTGPVVWVGSANDTWVGWTQNFESVMSIHGEAAVPWARQVLAVFNDLWHDRVPGYSVADAAPTRPRP